MTLLVLLLGCSEPVEFYEYPEPDAWEPLAGPGGPAVSFSEGELLEHCAYLLGDERDVEHHNLVVMHDGYLWLPWAPEDGGGGISVFDFSDPCAPVKVGEGYSEHMRETHALAFGEVDGREYLAVDYMEAGSDGKVGGVGFFDVTDRSAPVWVSAVEIPDFDYPDAYFRVSLASFWQGDVLYTSAGLSGTFAIDVSDPLAPEIITQHTTIAHLLGAFHAIGNVGMASSAGLALTILYDISDPWSFEDLSGGRFETESREGDVAPYYFANVGGEWGLFARNDTGGGPIVYDISDPSAPSWLGDLPNDDGDGGYIFRHHELLFQGESNYGAIYDASDPTDISLYARVEMQGDLDTVTPIGNVAVVSVDEKGEAGQATAVIPWDTRPDARGPTVKLSSPADGEVWVATSGRIGLSFDEMVERGTVFEGSFRVWDALGEPVPGRFNVQESLVNFTPDEPLADGMTYLVEIPAGGITDVSGNPTEASFSFAFSTGGAVEVPE